MAVEINDPRGAGLLRAMEIEAEDSRYRRIVEGCVLDVDYLRSRRATIEIDAPAARACGRSGKCVIRENLSKPRLFAGRGGDATDYLTESVT